jgi:hypothetical protein
MRATSALRRRRATRDGRSECHRPSTPSRWRREWLLPLVLAIATSSWMVAVEGRQGIGRDESQYFRAGERYWGWFESVWNNLREGIPAAFSRARWTASGTTTTSTRR